nr:MAG TPA: hypothetical protein [Caudoviricetes sp.]
MSIIFSSPFVIVTYQVTFIISFFCNLSSYFLLDL